MTAEVYIRDGNIMRGRGIEVAIIDRHPDGGVTVRRFEETRQHIRPGDDPHGVQPDSDLFVYHSNDEGRALYEALARHYGDAPTDSTMLRKDYEHERDRVDKLLDKAVFNRGNA